MVKRKTQLTIKVSRSRKKNLRLGRQNKTPLISQPCIKCPGLLDVIASPIIKLKKKQRTSPIKLTHRKRTFGSRSPGSPFCKGTPHRRQNFRPTPSKSPSMERLRGSSARSLFSSDDTYKAELLVFTDKPSADVHLNSQNNCDTHVPQKSDAMQSDSISQTPYERDIQEMYAILPDVLKTLEESGTKNPSWIFCRLVHSNNFPLDNIAYLLWVEVLRWYTMENTSSMR